jgi:hypothetical protein
LLIGRALPAACSSPNRTNDEFLAGLAREGPLFAAGCAETADGVRYSGKWWHYPIYNYASKKPGCTVGASLL